MINMTGLKNANAFITGASSGIGFSCAVRFAEEGARLILSARRKERIEKLAVALREKYGTECLPVQLDVRDQQAVQKAIDGLPDSWNAIDILVNNAGLGRGLDKLHEGKIEDWEEMIDTNIKGLLYVSRAVIPGMVKRQKGTVINIGSIAGREVYAKGNVYCATKHAVDALTKGMRLDLVDTPVRVCSVNPGMVETEFSFVRFRGDADRARAVYQDFTPLRPDDIAEVVVFCATRPPHVNVADVLVLPTNQASTTLMHRGSGD
jgi:3-hydroxy acid dehydrogenase / malonic semialdehyde reductase